MHSYRRSLVVRLDDVRRQAGRRTQNLFFRDQPTFGAGESRFAIHSLGPLLVHGQGRGENAGVRIRYAHPFKDALHASVFAPAPVQSIESHVWFDFTESLNDVAARIDLNNIVSFVSKRSCTFAPGGQRDLSLNGRAAHQHNYADWRPARHASLRDSAGTIIRRHCPSRLMRDYEQNSPTRTISHFKLIPRSSRTLRRIFSPSASKSVAVAPPRFMRKFG